jgi:hypothetical protein
VTRALGGIGKGGGGGALPSARALGGIGKGGGGGALPSAQALGGIGKGGGGGALPSACVFETFPRVLLTLVALGASISMASPHSARTASLNLMA